MAFVIVVVARQRFSSVNPEDLKSVLKEQRPAVTEARIQEVLPTIWTHVQCALRAVGRVGPATSRLDLSNAAAE